MSGASASGPLAREKGKERGSIDGRIKLNKISLHAACKMHGL
jgi:hypothetical protein